MLDRSARDIQLWKAWKANDNSLTRQALLKAVDPIISSVVNKQLGTISRPVLKLKAKSLAIKALHKYDPEKAKLSTFLVHQLAPLKRANMQAQNIIRMPENMQLKVRTYLDAKSELVDDLGREPTFLELKDHLAWSKSELERMERQLHNESSASAQIYEGTKSRADLDMKVDLVYRSLSAKDQLIFEHTLGYGGKSKLSNNDISIRLGVSAASISQRKKHIMNKLKEAGV